MPDIALGITSANGPLKSADADMIYSAAFTEGARTVVAAATMPAARQCFTENLISSSLFSFPLGLCALLRLEHLPVWKRPELNHLLQHSPAMREPARLEDQRQQDTRAQRDVGGREDGAAGLARIAHDFGADLVQTFLKQGDEGDAKDGADRALRAAYNQHAQVPDRGEQCKTLRRHELQEPRGASTGDAGEQRADKESGDLDAQRIDPHYLGGDVIVAHGLHGAAEIAGMQVERRADHDQHDEQREIVELPRRSDGVAPDGQRF